MPKFITLCAAAALLALTSAASAESFKRITKEADFRKIVVDKRLSADGNWMTVRADGTTKGRILNQKFNAAWVWKNRMYCRNAVMGNQKLGTDCQVVKVSGKSVQFNRKYGKGEAGVMRLP